MWVRVFLGGRSFDPAWRYIGTYRLRDALRTWCYQTFDRRDGEAVRFRRGYADDEGALREELPYVRRLGEGKHHDA